MRKTKKEILEIKKEHGLFLEYDREYFCGRVIMSKIKIATQEEIDRAFLLKKCDHSIVYDIETYMYDMRKCAICGKGLGVI